MAVVGAGYWGPNLVRNFLACPDTDLRWVADLDRERAAKAVGPRSTVRVTDQLETVLNDRRVDAVAVATPAWTHFEVALACLEAGKHVLVEKPLALNAAQAADIARLAADRGRFCMEALWTFFLPKFDVVRQLLEAGALGEIRTVQAEYGEWFTAGHRILRADLAGGPLLDLGTYPLSLATWVLGAPERVLAAGQPHPAGVNGQAAAILCDPRGNQAVLQTTLFSNTPTMATIAGTSATLTLPGPFYQPGDLVLTSADGDRLLTFTEPRTAHDALHFEAAEVARRIAEGRLESPIRPLAESILTLEVMDEIRRQIGVTFAGEH